MLLAVIAGEGAGTRVEGAVAIRAVLVPVAGPRLGIAVGIDDARLHVNYVQPRVVYADRYAEPWTRDWYEYCSDRYRTFNSRTGTFTGNDGEQHFCVAN